MVEEAHASAAVAGSRQTRPVAWLRTEIRPDGLAMGLFGLTAGKTSH